MFRTTELPLQTPVPNASANLRHTEYISRLEDFIYRQHNHLELGDIEDVFLVSNIIGARKNTA